MSDKTELENIWDGLDVMAYRLQINLEDPTMTTDQKLQMLERFNYCSSVVIGYLRHNLPIKSSIGLELGLFE